MDPKQNIERWPVRCRLYLTGSNPELLSLFDFYAPHFYIPTPTLFSRGITDAVFAKKIRTCKVLQAPLGIRESLSWITVPKLYGILKKSGEIIYRFDKMFIVHQFERILTDHDLAPRRSDSICKLISFLIDMKVRQRTGSSPCFKHPSMNCTIC